MSRIVIYEVMRPYSVCTAAQCHASWSERDFNQCALINRLWKLATYMAQNLRYIYDIVDVWRRNILRRCMDSKTRSPVGGGCFGRLWSSWGMVFTGGRMSLGHEIWAFIVSLTTSCPRPLPVGWQNAIMPRWPLYDGLCPSETISQNKFLLP